VGQWNGKLYVRPLNLRDALNDIFSFDPFCPVAKSKFNKI